MPSVTGTISSMSPKKMSSNHQPIGWAFSALVVGMAVSLATEFQGIETWEELKSVSHVMHGVQIAGGVFIGWVAQFLRK